MKNNFFVASYPKSGSSFLTRLVAQTLNASIGGSCPSQDTVEPISLTRNSNWIVRKGHYRILINEDKPLLPEPHTLNIAKLQGEPVLFIIRDPRDIVVSASKYHNKQVDIIIREMTTGKLYNLPRWDEYINMWAKYMCNRAQFIRYEDLIDDPVSILKWHLTLDYDESRLETAVKEQSFERQKPVDRHNLLRKGIAGDYKNVLTKKQIEMIEQVFGETMEEWGYL